MSEPEQPRVVLTAEHRYAVSGAQQAAELSFMMADGSCLRWSSEGRLTINGEPLSYPPLTAVVAFLSKWCDEMRRSM